MKLTRRVLKNRAKPVDFDFPPRNLDLQKQLLDFMKRYQGIGLAAPQVGISKRIFVIGIDDEEECFFNPEIISVSPEHLDFDEGCLSFPGEHCIIKRPEEVSVSYQDYIGQRKQKTLRGLWARCFQHELDHLDGVTMWDRYKEQNAKQS
jgi:peptide deformylase